jgi:hybrid cluster-associated redox disulfide protein
LPVNFEPVKRWIGGDKMAAQIKKDMLINDILQVDAGAAAILMAAGMHCVGCMAAAGETLEEAAAVHGMDAAELEKDINEYLAKKEAK